MKVKFVTIQTTRYREDDDAAGFDRYGFKTKETTCVADCGRYASVPRINVDPTNGWGDECPECFKHPVKEPEHEEVVLPAKPKSARKRVRR